MIAGLTADEVRDLILSVGTRQTQRRLSPTEVGRLIRKALASGAQLSDIADACHLRGTSMVSRFARLTTLPDDVQDLIGWGSSKEALSMTQAQELARVGGAQEQRRLAKLTIQHGLSAAEVRQVVQRVDRAREAVDIATESILKLRPVIKRQYVWVGAVTAEAVVNRLGAMTQAERDSLFTGLLRDLGHNIAGKLGPKRFTVAAMDEVGASLNIDAIEREVNDALARTKVEGR